MARDAWHSNGAARRRAVAAVRKRVERGEPCAICKRPIDLELKYPHPGSLHVDHVMARSRGGAMFDPENHAPAHFKCNVAKGDGGGRAKTSAKVMFVCGPPCSGKNAYVAKNRKPGDMVVDYDALMAAISGQPEHEHVEAIKGFVFDARDAITDRIWKRGTPPGVTAWVIHTAPDPALRADYARRGATVVLLDPGMDVCLARAAAERPTEWQRYIREWYARQVAVTPELVRTTTGKSSRAW